MEPKLHSPVKAAGEDTKICTITDIFLFEAFHKYYAGKDSAPHTGKAHWGVDPACMPDFDYDRGHLVNDGNAWELSSLIKANGCNSNNHCPGDEIIVNRWYGRNKSYTYINNVIMGWYYRNPFVTYHHSYGEVFTKDSMWCDGVCEGSWLRTAKFAEVWSLKGCFEKNGEKFCAGEEVNYNDRGRIYKGQIHGFNLQYPGSPYIMIKIRNDLYDLASDFSH